MRPDPPYRVFLGFDPNEMRAHNVATTSLLERSNRDQLQVNRLCRITLQGQYTRPTTRMPNGQLFDELSGAPMSTEHAIARFFVPYLCGYQGWALFTDGDVLFREDVRHLFDLADDRYAIQVVQHRPLLEEGQKKAGQIQQAYPRKNWSSVMLWNCQHPANIALTTDVCNIWPGRELHAFTWLDDELIGVLPERWNYLVGVNPIQPDPAIVHYTLGTPDTAGCEDVHFADEWFDMARVLGYRFPKVGVSSATGTKS